MSSKIVSALEGTENKKCNKERQVKEFCFGRENKFKFSSRTTQNLNENADWALYLRGICIRSLNDFQLNNANDK